MNTEQIHRDLGRVEGKLGALTTKVDGMDAKLDAALAALNRAKGIGFVGGALLSAGVAFLTSWFTK
jgi:hypothetical protein